MGSDTFELRCLLAAFAYPRLPAEVRSVIVIGYSTGRMRFYSEVWPSTFPSLCNSVFNYFLVLSDTILTVANPPGLHPQRGELLMSQLLHGSEVKAMRLRTPHPSAAPKTHCELTVLHADCVVGIEGFSLFTALCACLRLADRSMCWW
jgi:hypothetical protein